MNQAREGAQVEMKVEVREEWKEEPKEEARVEPRVEPKAVTRVEMTEGVRVEWKEGLKGEGYQQQQAVQTVEQKEARWAESEGQEQVEWNQVVEAPPGVQSREVTAKCVASQLRQRWRN